MEVELRQIATASSGEEFATRHYKKMKAKAGQLIGHCNAFIQNAITVKTDLAAVGGQLDIAWKEDWESRFGEYSLAQGMITDVELAEENRRAQSHRMSQGKFCYSISQEFVYARFEEIV